MRVGIIVIRPSESLHPWHLWEAVDNLAVTDLLFILTPTLKTPIRPPKAA
jgi:hypothetical protein